MDLAIRECCDEGKPITIVDPQSSVAKAYRELAATVLTKLGKQK